LGDIHSGLSKNMSVSNQPYYQQLANGITLIVTPNSSTDIVAGRLFLKLGNHSQPVAGLSHLVTTLLTKGTVKRSALEIAEIVESMGAGLGADANPDSLELSLKAVTQDFAVIFRLAGEILRHPSFPPEQIELERKLTLQAILSQTERPMALAFQQLRELIYQEYHPYSHPPLGTTTSIEKITRADLVEYHTTYFRPDQLVISLAGRITPAAAADLVHEIFGDWPRPDQPVLTAETSIVPLNPQRQTITKPTQQSIVMLGHLTVAVSHPHYLPLRLINTYLGSGLSSRLFVELREKRGLAYEVSSIYSAKLDRAIFAVYMGTTPNNLLTAINGLQGEMARLCVTRLSGEELTTTKNKLLGKYALAKQTSSQMAYIYGWYETLGLGWEFDRKFTAEIENVTTAQIEEVAHQHFSSPYYLSVVGPHS
jgi:zinc protease